MLNIRMRKTVVKPVDVARALRARGKVFLSAGLLIGHGRQLVGRL
jgi:hypothetical protein